MQIQVRLETDIFVGPDPGPDVWDRIRILNYLGVFIVSVINIAKSMDRYWYSTIWFINKPQIKLLQ
jgi:hypothetical protein